MEGLADRRLGQVLSPDVEKIRGWVKKMKVMLLSVIPASSAE